MVRKSEGLSLYSGSWSILGFSGMFEEVLECSRVLPIMMLCYNEYAYKITLWLSSWHMYTRDTSHKFEPCHHNMLIKSCYMYSTL